jgi:hypothetical protein
MTGKGLDNPGALASHAASAANRSLRRIDQDLDQDLDSGSPSTPAAAANGLPPSQISRSSAPLGGDWRRCRSAADITAIGAGRAGASGSSAAAQARLRTWSTARRSEDEVRAGRRERFLAGRFVRSSSVPARNIGEVRLDEGNFGASHTRRAHVTIR